jgi:hypothetical protein
MTEQMMRYVRERRADRARLFDDWLLNDVLQSAWRARVLEVLSVIFVFFAVFNGGLRSRPITISLSIRCGNINY